MTNEEKILDMLGKIQGDLSDLRDDVEDIKENLATKKSSKTPRRQKLSGKELILKMSKILTKEEADDLARVVAEQKRMALACEGA